jgi:hypothetical protein
LDEQANSIFFVDQTVRVLARKISESARHNPSILAELIDRLLKVTVLTTGHAVTYVPISKNTGIICGRRDEALQLNDGRFLKLVMKYASEDGQAFKLNYACVQYQLDTNRHSNRFIFRYDYDIDPKVNHPAAHLQIRGQLAESPVNKSLEEIRFPLVQVTIESILRLLVHDFDIVPNNPNWQQTLKFSEDTFIRLGKSDF